MKPYKSCNGLLGKALSGSVYQKAYSRFTTNPSCQLLVPIIQWIDCTSVTGNDRFSLKPYLFTPAIFTESFWRTTQAWGYHGYLPKRKTSTAQNQTQLQGDNIGNYHAQLSQVLHSFRTSESRLHRVTLPMGQTGVIIVDIVPCILYVIQDMQEAKICCVGVMGLTCHKFNANVDYKGLACHNRNCEYLYADPLHSIAQSNHLSI